MKLHVITTIIAAAMITGCATSNRPNLVGDWKSGSNKNRPIAAIYTFTENGSFFERRDDDSDYVSTGRWTYTEDSNAIAYWDKKGTIANGVTIKFISEDKISCTRDNHSFLMHKVQPHREKGS